MEPQQEKQGRFQIIALEDRIAPSVTVDVLGLASVDVHLDLELAVTTPVGANVDLSLNL